LVDELIRRGLQLPRRFAGGELIEMGNLRTITIVGGGLAGLTLGIGLRRQGIPVTIWEAGHYPRHRVCGEFISGRGQEILARLGLREQLIQAGAITSNTAMFLSGGAKSAARPLPKPALCLSRFVLDALLAKIFNDLGGRLRENESWPKSSCGKAVVRANGRRAHIADDNWLWFGLKVHARALPLEADLEMHLIHNGYIGLTRLPDNEVDVCGLFRRAVNGKVTGGKQTPPNNTNLPHGWQIAFDGNPPTELCNRLAKASIDQTSSCSVAGLSLRAQRATSLSELCIGDSLTMTPPVTGNGMSMAFESAELAIEPLASYSRGDLDWAEASHTLAQACDRAFARRLAWARWLQWMMFAPIFRGPMATLLLRSNWLWKTMFANTR
jgi:2-polyprenyl-6-methoxyphenol hydroxylase-like FAD-dependent oxidoreductase